MSAPTLPQRAARVRALTIERPHAILALLTGLNFLNYVDRYLIAAVAPKIQESLSLSNAMTGFVASAFMLGYFLTSPIFGHFADRAAVSSSRDPSSRPRSTRTLLIFVGVALWSIATVVSGFSIGAKSLIAARVAVGVGEASYATIAPTIIDELAPAGRKNQWLAIFYVAIPVGSALGYILGGFLEHGYGWRSAFYVAGAPGLLLALLVLLIAEPRRPPSHAADVASSSSLRTLARAPLYVANVAGQCMYTFALGGFAVWAPKFLYQTHDLPLHKADFGFGVVAVVAGVLGTATGAVLAGRSLPPEASDEARIRACLKFCAIAALCALPFSVATIYAPTARAFFVAIFLCELALFACTSPINVVTLGSVPASLRASAMAVSIFAIHAFGDFPSPAIVGRLADIGTLRAALGILPFAIALCAILWWIGARLPISKARDRLPSAG